jgi:hypothetical protein
MEEVWKIRKQHQHLHITSLNINIKQTLNTFAIGIVTKDQTVSFFLHGCLIFDKFI